MKTQILGTKCVKYVISLQKLRLNHNQSNIICTFTPTKTPVSSLTPYPVITPQRVNQLKPEQPWKLKMVENETI